MGPAIQDWPSLGARKKETGDHEINKGMLTNTRGKGYSNTKEHHVSLPPMRPSPIKPCTSISTKSQKLPPSQVSHIQPGQLEKESYRTCPSQQQNRSLNVCSSSCWAQGTSKDVPERNPQKVPCNPKNGSLATAIVENSLPPQICFSNKSGSNASRKGPVIGASTSAPQGDLPEQMFLDFESLMLIKEDADEDSGSDLSDSERIPIPPSPFTPPDLKLRAERIDPACFDHLFELDYKESEYYYSDFLPPPFNSWNLPQLAVFLNTEAKATSRPSPVGHLEKYVDRLLQLEWLQMETIQGEKAALVKSRPTTAPGTLRSLKSPTKSRSWYNPLHSRTSANLGDLTKQPTCRVSNNRRKGLNCEESSLPKAPKSSSMVSVIAHVKPPREIRPVLKKRPTDISKQQIVELQPSASMSQAIGNIRPQKNYSDTIGSAAPLKAMKITGNPKKNGMANNDHLPVQKVDRKVKTNVVKQSTCKRKLVDM